MKQIIHALALVTVFTCFACLKTFAQESTQPASGIASLPGKLFRQLDEKALDIDKKLRLQSEKYLKRMLREERELRKKVSRTDSVAAKNIFEEAGKQYLALLDIIKSPMENPSNLAGKYMPQLDSIRMAVKFLHEKKGLQLTGAPADIILKQAGNNLGLLKNNFSQADYLEQFMLQRRNLLLKQLMGYGVTKDLLRIQKNVYYYQAQVKEYKRLFNDPSFAEAKVLGLLRGTPAFKNFFQQHSELAGLFSLPGTAGSNPVAGFAALQNRNTTEQQLLQRFGYLPDMAQTGLHQQGQGPFQLSRVKEYLHKNIPGNNGDEMPDFTPNNQKTKSFLHRFELGSNLQTVKGNNFFPSTTDLGLSVGYKINDKSTIGLGGSYKMGWGKNIGHLSITHQGIGMRSFVDVKVLESLWLSGGAEMNYRSQFKNFHILRDYSPWQKSALLGLSKKYKVSEKLKGNMQLLYDFLYKEQVPRTQALVFRIGYIW